MSAFLDKLIVEEIDDSTWKVHEPFRYQSDLAGLISVPAGFKTDFASVPRIGLIYSLLGDTAHEPAVIHDWGYYCGVLPRKVCDKVILEAMGVIGMPWYRRWPIYAGVRAGGWMAWNAHRKAGDPQCTSHTPDTKQG